MNRIIINAFTLCCPLVLSACAGMGGVRGSSGTATTEQLAERNKALDNLVVEALKPCEGKGKAQDSGLIIVTAKPDGSLTQGATQWLGSEEMKACIAEQTGKTKLAAWNGPQVTSIWAVGTKEAPAPKALAEAPASYTEKVRDNVMRTQGNAGMGSDASTGPLAACAQRSLPMEAYALVEYRVFVFPDGKVVGVTPTRNEGEGKDAAYTDCVAESVRGWTFDSFPAPGFTLLSVPLKFGVNPSEK